MRRKWGLVVLTASIDIFHEQVKFESFSFGASLDTHLWLLSAATLPTNLKILLQSLILVRNVILAHSTYQTRKWNISPFTKRINLMRHFEEDFRTKIYRYMFPFRSFTFIKVTKTIFPNKNPEIKSTQIINKNHKYY